ncbi:MAG: HEAT repeat domain-containing protein [Anaerolineae bacterium]|nr:HEAT repeat domain-containing protein [Anaerolineae bacterium]MDW8298625.1 HEAT repeat domain-containing protein [Anaerolineae bacterium]
MSQTDLIQALISLLDSAEPLTSSALSERILEYGSKAVPYLIEALSHTRLSRSWRAANILAEIDDLRWFVPMVMAVRADNPLLGHAAANALAKRYPEYAIAPLVAALPFCHAIVQLRIIAILEELRATEAIPQLIELLASSDSTTMRTAILQALGTLGNKSLSNIARQYLDDPDPHVRKRARRCLAKFGELVTEANLLTWSF